MAAEHRANGDARPVAAERASQQINVDRSPLVDKTVAPSPATGNGQPSRIDPDTRWVQWGVVGLVVMLGLTSFIVSFRALYDVAAWAGLGGGIQWAVPVFIDGAILTYALSVLVHRARGEATWPSWTSLAVFTLMSVAANSAHAVSLPQEQWWQTAIGALIAALAPIGVFAATEQMARLVVLRPQDRQPATDGSPDVDEEPAPRADSADEPTDQEPASTEAELPAAAVDEAKAVESAPPPAAVEPARQQPAAIEPAPAPEQPVEPSPVPVEAAESDQAEGQGADEFVEWVIEQRRHDRPITGRTAGDFLEVSERTGRNRIKELRHARPELFEGDDAA